MSTSTVPGMVGTHLVLRTSSSTKILRTGSLPRYSGLLATALSTGMPARSLAHSNCCSFRVKNSERRQAASAWRAALGMLRAKPPA